jgi:hypothetical protein
MKPNLFGKNSWPASINQALLPRLAEAATCIRAMVSQLLRSLAAPKLLNP